MTELVGVTQIAGDVGSWAATALTQLDWLGTPVLVDDPVGIALAIAFQNEVAVGRPLRHPAEHYGEAAIVALASRAQHLRPRLLSDDYDAQILAHNHQVEPLSVHKLLTSMIAAGHVTPQTAAGHADDCDKPAAQATTPPTNSRPADSVESGNPNHDEAWPSRSAPTGVTRQLGCAVPGCIRIVAKPRCPNDESGGRGSRRGRDQQLVRGAAGGPARPADDGEHSDVGIC